MGFHIENLSIRKMIKTLHKKDFPFFNKFDISNRIKTILRWYVKNERKINTFIHRMICPKQ